MDIDPLRVTIEELVEGFKDESLDDGPVVGWGGNLNIRPSYQREFIYTGKNRHKRDKVIETILNDHPLGVMYWAELDNGKYEVLDGQQRIMSICQYVAQKRFAYKGREFHSLEEDEQIKFNEYDKMTVYICKGKPSEKIEWFETINIAGLTLTTQEMNNAVFHGAWVDNAKQYFSKTSCPADTNWGKYIASNVDHRRQELLELAIKWRIMGMKNQDGKPMSVREYMSSNKENDAKELWEHFESVMKWAKKTFKYRSIMKGLNWGKLYYNHKDDVLDPIELETRIDNLIKDEYDELKSTKGIYEYVLTDDKHCLDIRKFNKGEREKLYARCGGTCIRCGEENFTIEQMEADHIDPWKEGGNTRMDNAQMLCKPCNRRKGAK